MPMELCRPAIERVLVSLVRERLTAIRGTVDDLPPVETWGTDTPLGTDGLAADSMELLTLAGDVTRYFHLHEAGVEDYLLRYRRLGEWVEIIEAARDRGATAITFATSGTTGEPRFCDHGWAGLAQEIDALAGLFPDRRRVVGTVPAHHIYGFLFTVLLPTRLGIPVRDTLTEAVPGLSRSLTPGDLIVSHPLYWAYIARTRPRFPEDVQGVTSTAPCPPELAGDLKAAGLERLVEIYGATETGGIGVRESPDAPFRLLDHWTRVGDRVARTLPGGRRESPVSPPDHLVWETDRCFRPAGRRDGAVQVGGINVFPEAVARRIAEHPWVADCAVRPGGAAEGGRLKALIVLEGDMEPDGEVRRALRRWMEKQLTTAERPVRIDFGPAVVRNEMGKSINWSAGD